LGHERIIMRLDAEPSDHMLWLMWYVFRLHMEEPAAKTLGEYAKRRGCASPKSAHDKGRA
jgi:hypothetical protein